LKCNSMSIFVKSLSLNKRKIGKIMGTTIINATKAITIILKVFFIKSHQYCIA